MGSRTANAVTLWPVDGGPLLASVVTSTSGTIAGVAAVTGSVLRIYRIWLVAAGATNLTFEDGATALSGAVPLTTSQQIFLPFDSGWPHFVTSAGNAFNIGNSGGVQISGTIWYTQSPPTTVPAAQPFDAL